MVALVLIFLLLVLLTLVTVKKHRDMVVVAAVPASTSPRRVLYRTGGVTDRMRSDRQRRTGMGVMDG